AYPQGGRLVRPLLESLHHGNVVHWAFPRCQLLGGQSLEDSPVDSVLELLVELLQAPLLLQPALCGLGHPPGLVIVVDQQIRGLAERVGSGPLPLLLVQGEALHDDLQLLILVECKSAHLELALLTSLARGTPPRHVRPKGFGRDEVVGHEMLQCPEVRHALPLLGNGSGALPLLG
ncbi:MAG: hypothetical protein AN484_27875, partial [Aphanizomenon flos-aquae WA102]